MSDAALIHLVRHGEVHNPEGVLYERLPGFGLSARGRQMAEVLGDWFATAALDLLISSPLQRAQETMTPIAAKHELDFEIDQRLIEASNRLAGQPLKTKPLSFIKPANFKLYCNPWRPSWGEPYAQVAERMSETIFDAARRVGPGGQAVLVSHQSPIWLARLKLEGKRLVHSPLARQCRLASVTSFTIRDDRCIGVGYVEPAVDLYDEDSARPFSSGGRKR